jgi:peptidoglycan/xylan/chitin deacetylase (PgdA/CDA1 family)
VAELERDPQLLAVHPERFDRHMEILSRQTTAVPLHALVPMSSENPASGRAVAVTFDDGYADNLETAKPILERHGIPATVFVVAGMVGSREEFWWDELERLLLCVAPPFQTLGLAIGGRALEWNWTRGGMEGTDPGSHDGWTIVDPHDPSPAHGLYRELVARIRVASPDDQTAAIAALRSWVGSDGVGRSTHRVMGFDDLERLADGGLVSVGSHGLRHLRFANLTPADRRHQMTESRRLLEEITGGTVDEFAYPFGAPIDLPEDDSTELRAAGYRLACANFEATVGPGTNRFRLPRFLVRDWSREEFAHRLGQWFGHHE